MFDDAKRRQPPKHAKLQTILSKTHIQLVGRLTVARVTLREIEQDEARFHGARCLSGERHSQSDMADG